MNVLPCELSGASVVIEGFEMALGNQYPDCPGVTELGIRPEHVKLSDAKDDGTGLPARVEKVDDIGRFKIVQMTLGNQQLKAIVEEGVSVPTNPYLTFSPEHIHIYADSVLLDRQSAATAIQGGAL